MSECGHGLDWDGVGGFFGCCAGFLFTYIIYYICSCNLRAPGGKLGEEIQIWKAFSFDSGDRHRRSSCSHLALHLFLVLECDFHIDKRSTATHLRLSF